MTVGENQAISLFPEGILGIMLQDVKIKGRKDFSHTQGTGAVTALRIDQHADNILAENVSHKFKLDYLFLTENSGQRLSP